MAIGQQIIINVSNTFILPLSRVGIKDIEIVGGKNASLGEMIQNVTSLGIDIPDGFVITVDAYRKFMTFNGFERKIVEIIKGIDFDKIESLRRGGHEVRLLLQMVIFRKR